MSERAIKPGASRIREVISILNDHGLCVLPREWDAEHVLAEVNERIKANFLRAELKVHGSLALEGLVGARCKALLLKRSDPTKRG